MNIRKAIVLSLGLVACFVSMTSRSMAQVAPDKIADFTGGIGINTHLSIQWSTDYPFTAGASNQPVFSQAKLNQFEAAIQYVGAHVLRDNMAITPEIDNPFPNADGTPGPTLWQKIHQDIGVTFDFPITGEDQSIPYATKIADAISSIEGPNEVNDKDSAGNYWFIFVNPDGSRLSGIPAAQAEQPLMYSALKQNPVTAKIPVIQYSLGNLADISVAGNVTAAAADEGNAHVYFGSGNPPGSGSVADTMADSQIMTPNKPVYVTETGYPTMQGNVNSVSPAVQASYTLSLLLDNWKAGARNILLYEISDYWPDPTGTTDREYHFGIFNSDWTPKPAAIALHNMMSILADTSVQAPSPAPALAFSFTYDHTPVTTTLARPRSLDGIASYPQAPNIQSHLFVRNDGVYILALWNDVRLSDPTEQIDVSVPNVSVMLNLGLQASQIQIFDPLVGTSAIETDQSLGGLGLPVPAHPIFVFITPPTSCGIHASGSTYAVPSSVTTGSTSVNSSQCPWGATQSTQTTISQNYSCTNGVETAVGTPVTQTTNVGDLTCVQPDIPSVTLPTTISQPVGTVATISGIAIVDPWGQTQARNMQLNITTQYGLVATTSHPTPSKAIFLEGSLAQLNAELATLSYTAPARPGLTDHLGINPWNQAGQSFQAYSLVTITDIPSVTLPATLSQPAGTVAAISGIAIVDPWGQTQARNMQLNITTQYGLVATTSHPTPSKAIFLEGSLAQLNAELATLSYTAPAQSGVTDHLGIDPWNQAGQSFQAYSLVTINDKPSVTLPATLSQAAGTVATISGISIVDPWGQTQARNMQLNITTQYGLVATASHPTPSKAIFLEGSLAQLNAELATLSYTAPAQSGVTEHLGIDPWNQAAQSLQTYALINITDNDIPSVTLPATLSQPAGTVATISGISIVDPWGQTQKRNMQLNITTQYGLVATASHPTPSKAIFLEGSLAQLNAELATLSYTAPAQSGVTDHLGINPWNQAGQSFQAYSLVTITDVSTFVGG